MLFTCSFLLKVTCGSHPPSSKSEHAFLVYGEPVRLHVRRAFLHQAFLLVWVAALDAPTTFGTNGEKLLELYRRVGS